MAPLDLVFAHASVNQHSGASCGSPQAGRQLSAFLVFAVVEMHEAGMKLCS